MTTAGRPGLPLVAVVALTTAFAALAAAFVAQNALGTFADDSVSYLVMAQVLSPWHPASQAVAEMFAREAFYPPLFPALLALAGAAHDPAWAHVLTALLLAACLPLAYALGARWLESRWAAVAAIAVTALLPAVWIQARGILSEPLFCLLLLATLYVAALNETDGADRRWTLALLLSGLALTRTVGLVLVLAYGAWSLARPSRSAAARAGALLPALAAFVAYAAWVLVRPSGTSDDYMRIVAERLSAIWLAASPLAAAAQSIARQANSIAAAWVGALMLFWVEGQPLRPLLAAAVGVLALAGLVVRFAARKADAWMLAAYLATFLVWPFYDQMTRFLFPALPVLVLYAFWTLRVALREGRAPLGQAVLALLVLSLAGPALAFIAQRARAAEPYVAIIDWYRTPDLREARARAQVQLDLLADMKEIRRLTQPQDRVMWFTPSYIALIAGRRAVPAPAPELAADAYRQAVSLARPNYVFLSAYNPRDTIRDTAWHAGLEALTDRAEAVHVRKRADGAVSSVLLRLDAALVEAQGR